MKRRNVLSSPRLSELKKRRRRAIINKILITIVVLSALTALSAYASRLPGLNISNIQVSGNKVVDADKIKAAVETKLAGKYLWLFPKANVLLYPKGSIKSVLYKEFPRLKEINLSAQGQKTLLVLVAEREPKYTWCGPVPETSLGAKLPDGSLAPKTSPCYFVDEEGYIFDEAPYFSGNVYFKLYGPRDNAGNAYFLKKNFKQLISFRNTFPGFHLKPVSVYIKEDGDAEMYLAKGGAAVSLPKIIFNIHSDLEKTAENLETALSTEPLKSKFKNNYAALEYIDLRYGNKVYDKFLATP